MRDRPGEPVDVAGLEGRDLAERVSVELPELDNVRGGRLQGGQRGRPEPGIAPSVERTSWLRGAPRFTVEPLGPQRLLTARRRRGTGGGVAWPEGVGRIKPAGDRARRSRLRRSARATSRRTVGVAGPRAARSTDPELLVGPVDLGHLSRRRAGDGGIGARDVRVVHAGQLSPGGLDRGLRSAMGDPQDEMRISLWHEPSVSSAGA